MSKPDALVLQLWPLAGIDNFRRIDRILIHLLLQNPAILSDQKIHSPRGLIFIDVDSVLARNVAAPITQQRECDSNLIGERLVGEGAIHAHTQDLGVGRIQPLQILLERLHLLGSTPGKGKDVEGKNHVFLPAVLAQRNILEVVAIKVFQREIGRHVAHLGHSG